MTPLSDPVESASSGEHQRRLTFKIAKTPVAVRLAVALIVVAAALAIARGPIAVGQTTLNGLVAAGYFSLGAVGLTLVFGALRIINFAHGDLLTLGAYLTLGMTSLGLPFWPAAVVAIAATAGVALVLDWIVWEPIRRQRANALQLFLVAIGLAMVIRYTIQFFAGSQPRSVGQDVLSTIAVGPFHLGTLQALALVPDALPAAAVPARGGSVLRRVEALVAPPPRAAGDRKSVV